MLSSDVQRPPFGALLRRKRLTAGLSQDQLAEGSRISVQAVSALERGVRFAPRPDTLALLVNMLELSGDEREEFERIAKASAKKKIRRAERAIDRAPESAAWAGPVFADAFFGRASEREELARALRTERCVTIWGPGGVGKTRLVVETLNDAHSDPGTGVVFVSLAAAIVDDAVAATVAQALGLRDAPPAEVAPALVAELGERRTLLVLDNCEHVVDGVSALVEMLLARTPSVTLVCTSRERLRVTGEHVMQLGPLEQADSIHLFGDRASLDVVDAEAVATICRRLDGLPLALELAAARVPSLGLSNVRRALDERFALLTRGRRTDDARHQTLRATIAWSYALLSPAERVVFERIALINGRFSLDDAIAISCDGSIARYDVVDAIAGLIEKAMLSVVDGDDRFERPYLLLESTRAFALGLADRERTDPDPGASRRRLGAYLIAGVRSEQRPFSDVGPGSFEGIDPDTVRGFLHWAIEEKHDPLLGARLTGFLGSFWDSRGLYSEGLRWCESVLRIVPANEHSNEARIQTERCAAMFYIRIGRHSAAMDVLGDAYALAKREGNPSLLLWTTVAAAKCAAANQDIRSARAFADEASALFEALAGEPGLPKILLMEAFVAVQSGDFERGRDAYRELVSVLDASPDESADYRLRNQALVDLAEIEYGLGNFAQAAAIGRRNIENLAGASASLRVSSLSNLCIYLVCEGSYDEARAYALRGLALARETGSTLFVAMIAQALAMVALYRCDRIEAAAEIFGWTNRLFEAGSLDLFDRMTRDRLVGLLDAAFSPEDLAAAMQRGALLREEEVADLALSLAGNEAMR